MGETKVAITLTNETDKARVECGVLKEIRQITVTAKVDTGAMNLYIDEAACQKLGLEIEADSAVRVADGRQVSCKVTAPVGIRWQDRYMSCNARVMPGLAHPLLGVIPLESMDLMVDPVNQRLVGVHGNEYLEEIG